MAVKRRNIQPIKVTYVKKDGGIKPMPPFMSLGEEAVYWDTHTDDALEKGTATGFHQPKDQTLSVRFAEKDLQELRHQAEKKGMGPTTLARMWLLEKLYATQK
jgi:predicted DNA binding CopG/RHH family protein